MSALSRSRLLSIIACCMMIGLLVISLAYVLSPWEANLNVSFEPPGYIGEDGRYVGVTIFTLTNEDTTPIRGIGCRYRYLDRESGRVVKSEVIKVGDLEPGQAKHCAVSCLIEDGRRYEIGVDLRYWWPIN